MNRDDVIARLKSTEPLMKRFGIGGLFLFGSYARGDFTEASDIDVFVDKINPQAFGLSELMGGYHAVVDALPGMKVSYGTRAGLDHVVRDEIEKSAIRIF